MSDINLINQERVSVAAQLGELIRETIAAHPDESAEKIASLCADATPADLVHEFYAHALTQSVADVMRRQTRDSLDRTVGKNRSPKLEQRRRWWAELLASRVSVDGKTKLIRDCTVDDLAACVDERRQLIARIEGQILNYDKLIALMVKHGARTVADLPEQNGWGA